MDDVRTSIDAARRRAVPMPWTPPFSTSVPPEQLHQHLVAEHVMRVLRPCQRALDGVGLRGLAFEVQHLVNVIDQAVTVARRVA